MVMQLLFSTKIEFFTCILAIQNVKLLNPYVCHQEIVTHNPSYHAQLKDFHCGIKFARILNAICPPDNVTTN